MIDIILPPLVSINNSIPFFWVRFEPSSAPTADPTIPPIIAAISDSGSESVTFLPTEPPIRAPAAAPVSLSPSMVTLDTSKIVPMTTYCCF